MKMNLDLHVNDFDEPVMEVAMEHKWIQKEQADSEMTTKDLAKFDPNDFEQHEDAFLNLLAQT